MLLGIFILPICKAGAIGLETISSVSSVGNIISYTFRMYFVPITSGDIRFDHFVGLFFNSTYSGDSITEECSSSYTARCFGPLFTAS